MALFAFLTFSPNCTLDFLPQLFVRSWVPPQRQCCRSRSRHQDSEFGSLYLCDGRIAEGLTSMAEQGPWQSEPQAGLSGLSCDQHLIFVHFLHIGCQSCQLCHQQLAPPECWLGHGKCDVDVCCASRPSAAWFLAQEQSLRRQVSQLRSEIARGWRASRQLCGPWSHRQGPSLEQVAGTGLGIRLEDCQLWARL